MTVAQSYTIESVASITGGVCYGKENLIVKTLSIDSRSLQLPGETLFFALVGARHDGHLYIKDLYQKGVRAFVVSNSESTDLKQYPEAGFVLVHDTLIALQNLAENHRKNFSFPVIGITGSNGKTIVKEWLYQLLNESYSIVRSPKSYNSQVGVPLSVWNMNSEANLAIFEAGISQPGEMDQLSKIIQPTYGIFTHFGDAHRENFKDEVQKLEEKIKLFSSCDSIVYCADNKLVDESLKSRYGQNRELISWSRNQAANLMVVSEEIKGNRTFIKIKYKKETKEINLPFSDKASIDNAITCWLCLLNLNVDDETIKERFPKLEPVAMRLEIKEGIGDCTLINDYYNSDLGSLGIALDLMNQQQKDKSKTIILSDIFQSGYTNHQLYKAISKLLEQKKINRLIGIGEGISSQSKLFTCNASFYRSTDVFLADLNRNQFKDEIILIKGARNFHFERISNALQYKAHQTVLEVNLNAMVHNLNYFRSLLKPSTKLVVMVKAFSYGSGSTEIANLLQYHRVNYLAVAIADEGVELRNAGITIPIMVMNPEPHSFDTMIEYRLEPEIYNQTICLEFEKALKRNGVRNYPIHIKLDTGMNRLGFVHHDIDTLLSLIVNNDHFFISSVFSHLAGADEQQHDDFTTRQIDSFTQWSDQILSQFSYPIDRHILNSAGIERFPQAQFNMVRLGIGLYGISAIHQEKLMNVSSLKTTISQIKEVSKENTVGYGRKGQLQTDTRIGVIPIGYADGFNRKLSNGLGKVMVNGQLVPVVGNICMDMSMIDLTNTDAKEGDSVLIFGDDYSVSKLAEQLDTIPYEILTTISRRVKRVYFQE
ncbi:bifunctional UDP-N-acetylmuramoyl-tripeptide:D-alanyl-D-alanine ligase/alanine racemase [Labilibaculum sp. A4]|uniref:bifunctional UDP-N-acetylmuramoyl-tripeptide:D-alanyl-D-alanine ligase/alanine racemase n=1 Tax=Labilibaculum euxinus TaxID=2686357 RepID=UPI000F61CEE5|nr:bifunctional UDP-N-acetylmuramoyl-tripeptide:D-alanyl-D-alanine ligase/alanine racemase [Labilibaculum euxinus]MDQ1771359.1 bifunctional UDP-N-acetylmuramoyl-tripeptide:D-alanyl-D-alanine ligase/alanine racemase [Labilibaculum euxinus]MWN77147.1 bifunctional UDP-N-acetylmuramoyl-tripeptide:D-alanyl-D-alanine ligase/alanine racemase [Labilibaculum euxinus]